MAQGQQQQGTFYEGGIGWAILLAVFAALIWLFWYFFHVEVRDAVRWIRYGEMWVISWFIDGDTPIQMVRNPKTGLKELWTFDIVYEKITTYKKSQLKYWHLSLFTNATMVPCKKVFLMTLGLGVFWCNFLGPNTQFRRRMTIEILIEAQKKNFPVIAPFLKFNPTTQPPRPPGAPVPADLPLFAEALGPEEWLAYNSIPVPDGNIDEATAWNAFEKQLGDRWQGPNALDDYKQILLAAFCLKAARKRGDSDAMLGRIAKCWSAKEGLKLSKDGKLIKDARKVLADKDIAGKTLTQANRHAFETTALVRALAFAREEGGVLAPATFVWLRGHDRTLWYPLNNTGRQSFHMEALGAMSHYKAERLTQRPIPVAKLENAVKTIRDYMKTSKARPIPQLDYSNSKKRGIKKAV